jgi:hypothetical protein
MLILESLTEKVLGAAYEVHRVLGPGLLESTYRSYEAQTITFLKHGKFPVGLLINFNVRHLKAGIHRFLRSCPVPNRVPSFPGVQSVDE